VHYELENPALHPLYTEQLLSDQSVPARKIVRRIASEGHVSFEAIIKEGRRSGEFRKDFDVRLLDIAIVGLREFIVVGQPILEAWLSAGERMEDLRRRDRRDELLPRNKPRPTSRRRHDIDDTVRGESTRAKTGANRSCRVKISPFVRAAMPAANKAAADPSMAALPPPATSCSAPSGSPPPGSRLSMA